MGKLHKMSYTEDDNDKDLPPAAVKRGSVLRRFDAESPNFFGLKCWAKRWMVVDSTHLYYYLNEQKEIEDELHVGH